VRKRFSKLWVFVSLSLVGLALFAVVSRKYFWLYFTRKADPPPVLANFLSDPKTSNNPEVLLGEANRLAWLFNWPKGGPLYARAEELFKAKGDTPLDIRDAAERRRRCR